MRNIEADKSHAEIRMMIYDMTPKEDRDLMKEFNSCDIKYVRNIGGSRKSDHPDYEIRLVDMKHVKESIYVKDVVKKLNQYKRVQEKAEELLDPIVDELRSAWKDYCRIRYSTIIFFLIM